MEYIARNNKIYAVGSIDEVDLDLIDGRNINLLDTGYARIGRKRLHVLIMERMLGRRVRCGFVIDHKNRNRLDDRRINLREVSAGANVSNQTRIPKNGRKCIGSRFIKSKNKWQAQIKINGKQIYLGLFKTEEAAEVCYLSRAKEIGYLI